MSPDPSKAEELPELRELRGLIAELERVAPRLAAGGGGAANASNSSITINAGAVWGIAFALFGFVALVVAVAAVLITREQVAQLRHEVEAVRDAADIATANDAQHARRLSTIEGELKVIVGAAAHAK